MIGLFPRGCTGAVSFTYDDALDVHIDHAAPDLESHNLRGTFYIPTRQQPSGAWPRRPDEWRNLAIRGHEIANHTQHHPCGRHFNWIKPGMALEDYDLVRMETELRAATDEIRNVCGPSSSRTFAYTCSEDYVSPEKISFRPLADRLFIASRGGTPTLADPQTIDFSYVPSLVIKLEMPLQEILDFIDRAASEHKWAVLMFHGCGGGHRLDVTRDNHQAICQHIAVQRSRLWCDTFENVATDLRQALDRPWPAA